jgi:hypothetical protein
MRDAVIPVVRKFLLPCGVVARVPCLTSSTPGLAHLLCRGYIVAGCVDKGVFGKFGLVHAVQVSTLGPLASSSVH